MPLKSLELVGYKTFASKTTFTFADSITAVVGPNGSGKSNIADAIRWVLGEQSYSLLRGKKTIDMIFSGSQQRAPAGMASATVTFDNADGWLPIDFTEVAITRRAYRDGQNEYLINNQKVRLRDVSELLGHSGLAERTYTIIGQGLVDAALSLKAEERRKLFEEAAGIGVYRSRREDALKRLEKTRRNLERVKDILAELKPRLRSLDRQARRAAEHEQIKTDLHVLLREWYGYHWHQQQKELREARETAREQNKNLSETRGRQSALADRMQTQRDRIHSLRSMLAGWQEELSAYQNQRERISRELAVTIERQRAVEERKSETLAERSRLEEEQKLQDERLERIVSESERLNRRAEEAAEQQREFQSALDDRLKEQSSMTESIRETERTISELDSESAAQRARMEELHIRIRSLEATRAELEKNIAAADDEARRADTNRAEARAALTNVSGQMVEAGQAVSADQAELERQERELEVARGAVRDLARTTTRLGTQLEVLEQAEQSLSGYSDGARMLIEAGHSGDLDGIGPSLGSLLQPPQGLEPAVTAVVGPYLDVILVGGEHAAQVIEYLQRNRSGGSILTDIRHDDRDRISGDIPGAHGVLADLVDSPPEYQPVVDLFLGSVLLVENREAAETVLNQGRPGVDVVTMDGVLYRANGMISTAGSSEGGLLERRRRREEISDALAAARQAAREAAAEEDRLAGALEKSRAQQAADRAELESLRSAEAAARSRVSEASSEIDRIRAQRNWSTAQLTDVLAEIEESKEAAARAEAELARVTDAAVQARNELTSQRGQLAEISMSELQTQAAHWQTQAAVTRRAAEDAGARAEDRRTAQKEIDGRLTALKTLLSELKTHGEALELEHEKLIREEVQVQAQIKSAQTRIEPNERELRELENRLEATQEAETEARKALTAAERNHSQAQIVLARKQEALDNLREKIEDDFGLVAFDYDDEVAGPNPLPLGSLVKSLPHVEEVAPELGASIKRQRAQLRRMGAINPDALEEFREVSERFEFLTAQVEDLNQAEEDILETVNELDLLMEREFRKTFDRVAREFRETFTRLFGGGSARLVLTNPEDLTDSGVDIEAQLPGRRTQGLSLLSGGERSLTAAALVLSLIRVSPTPFCVLDEVDAMLDEANVNRLAELLRELSERTQFILITHNRNTVQTAELIYGITMARDSTSQVLGLKLDEVADIVN